MKSIYVKGLLALGVVASAVAVSGAAFAQSSNLAGSVSTVQTNINNIPQLISGVCYILGAGMFGAGLLKLKAHSENPGQTPMAHGLGRVVVGALLLAAPAMSGWIQTTIAGTGTAVGYSGFSTLN